MTSIFGNKKGPNLTFEGHEDFRLRLVLSTLSGQSITIKGIHPNDLSIGLKGKYSKKVFNREQII